MLDFLNDTAFTVLGEHASWAELGGFVTGLWDVWLVVRQHILNWPIGILNVALLMVAFWSAGLYGDAGLQIVYVVLGFYGWWQWLQGTQARQIPVRRTSRTEWTWLAAGGIASTALLYWVLDAYLGSKVPLADAITTALSLVATYGQCRKLVENWWFWIAADIIYIPLYEYKGLRLTMVLYVVFLGLAITGLIAWRRDMARVATTANDGSTASAGEGANAQAAAA